MVAAEVRCSSVEEALTVCVGVGVETLHFLACLKMPALEEAACLLTAAYFRLAAAETWHLWLTSGKTG